MRFSKASLLALAFAFAAQSGIFGLSFAYRDPDEPFDSPVRLRSYSRLGEERMDVAYYGEKDEWELPDEVYVEIAGPGGEIYQQYGHAGIILEYDDIGRVVFDYGVFDSGAKDFIPDFIHGNLYYSLYAHRPDSWERTLMETGRSLKIYRLVLTPRQKHDIQQFLVYNSRECNSYYLYDFFRDNCSTRIRDILDSVYDGQLSSRRRAVGTYRSSIETAVRPFWKLELLYNVWQGSVQDRPISEYDAMFLPEYLEMGLKTLVSEQIRHYPPAPWENPACFGGGFYDIAMESIFTDSFGKAKPTAFRMRNEYSHLCLSGLREKTETVPAAELYFENDWNVLYSPTVREDGKMPGPNYLAVIALTLFVAGVNVFCGMRMKTDVSLHGVPAVVSALLAMFNGICSVVSIYMSLFSIHYFMWRNFNLLILNPVLIVSSVVLLMFAHSPESNVAKAMACVKVSLCLCVAALLLKPFYMQKNLYVIISFLACNVSLLWFLYCYADAAGCDKSVRM